MEFLFYMANLFLLATKAPKHYENKTVRFLCVFVNLWQINLFPVNLDSEPAGKAAFALTHFPAGSFLCG